MTGYPEARSAATVRPVVETDLPNIKALWNDGAVMRFVGFPDGLGVDDEYMARWFKWVTAAPDTRQAFAIEVEGLGYCGEAFYQVNPELPAIVDIKLTPAAQGLGLGHLGLSHALDELFANTTATAAMVDPHQDNTPALRLYERLGFTERPWPTNHPEPATDHRYLEVTRNAWLQRRGSQPDRRRSQVQYTNSMNATTEPK